MRVPGIGVASALKIVQARKFGRLHKDQLKKIGISFNKAKHFIRFADSPLQLREEILTIIVMEWPFLSKSV